MRRLGVAALDVFDQRDEDGMVLLAAAPAPDLHDAVRESAVICRPLPGDRTQLSLASVDLET
ncbi:hypothetical protein ACIRPX_42870 [Streptomyces sp. NPDC101225]|uniref:hypothetical protein n=1 Tax=Streptomyces sp. NPDC101225 TaxID=3366135 RepID=UPI0037F123B5